MRVSRQRAVESPEHRGTRLEAERSRCRRREERIPTQAEDAATTLVLNSVFY